MATDVFAYGRRSDRNPNAGADRASALVNLGRVMRDPRRRWARIQELKRSMDRGFTWWAENGILRSGADGAGIPTLGRDPRLMIAWKARRMIPNSSGPVCPCGNHRLSSHPCCFGGAARVPTIVNRP